MGVQNPRETKKTKHNFQDPCGCKAPEKTKKTPKNKFSGPIGVQNPWETKKTKRNFQDPWACKTLEKPRKPPKKIFKTHRGAKPLGNQKKYPSARNPSVRDPYV